MSRRTVRVVAIVAVLAILSLGIAMAASAVGPGTWTKITTPSTNVIYPYEAGGPNNFTVAGHTSPDVSSVDIDCISTRPSGAVQAITLMSNVVVTSGTFNVTPPLTNVPSNCRLRAIPAGVDLTVDYLGSYAGPIFYSNGFLVLTPDGVNPMGYTFFAGKGTGSAATDAAGQCGANGIGTITTPAMQALGATRTNVTCILYLPHTNISPTGTPTASSIVVDGHNAYLPLGVWYLKTNQGLAIAQTRITTTFTRHANGDVTATESGPLVRCSVDDTYPANTTSCPSTVDTGVRFSRTVDIFRGAHQIRFRDSFRSTNGLRHSVHPQYQAVIAPAATGRPGYRYPGHGSAFVTSTTDQVVTGLGTKTGTLFVRSDIHALEGDPQADTLALSWSRAPSKVQFSHTDATAFALPYSLTVPAGGRASLGFAVSGASTTSGAASVAKLATQEMVLAPTIRSPKPRAVIHGHLTTVKGSVFLGANGMPTSVKVNGHAAKVTKVSATRANYVVSFNESFARHKLTVVARDIAGNTKASSVRVTNKA